MVGCVMTILRWIFFTRQKPPRKERAIDEAIEDTDVENEEIQAENQEQGAVHIVWCNIPQDLEDQGARSGSVTVTGLLRTDMYRIDQKAPCVSTLTNYDLQNWSTRIKVIS